MVPGGNKMQRVGQGAVALFLLVAVCGAQDDLAQLRQEVQRLRTQVESMQEEIAGMSVQRGPEPKKETLTIQAPPDSQTATYDPDFTLKSKSLEWLTNSMGLAEQINLYRFVTNGTYSTLTSTNFGYITNNMYAALVRHNTTNGPVLEYAKISTIPDGEQMYDILYWNSNTVQWVLLHFPHNEATQKYQVLQHRTDGTLNYDWIRLH